MAAATGIGFKLWPKSLPGRLIIEAYPGWLPADGFSQAELRVRTAGADSIEADYRFLRGARSLRLQGRRLVASVLPGEAVIEARAEGYRPARLSLQVRPVYSDSARDGTPDFLRLNNAADREAFVTRFAQLAEAQGFRPRETLPAEISDCAALIRYAYRESFRDSAVAETSPVAPPEKYEHPYTPLGPRIFRVAPGTFRESDLANGAFAEFADARTLMRYNTHFISRDIGRAEAGDLLFYRQADQRMPFHAMIYVGRRGLQSGSEARVVYHTGPSGSDPGEIRRPSVAELMLHERPQWRPVQGNSNFLGVYRWNILKEEF
jgi:uncharacterized protein YfaT (DUF1175 family)